MAATEVKRQTQKEHYWKSWVGSISDLEQLSDKVEDCFNQRKSALLRSYSDRISELEDDPEAEVGKNNEKADELRRCRWKYRDLEEVAAYEVRIKEPADSIQGPSREVINEIDKRVVKQIKLVGRIDYSDEVVVDITDEAFKAGVTLSVSSSERGWARQTFQQIFEEIEKGVPTWGNLRGSGKVAIAGMIAVFIFLFLLFHSLFKHASTESLERADGGPITLAIYSALLPTLVMGMYVSMSERLSNFLFPPFELTGEDGHNSGSRRIGYVLSLIVTIAIGIVVNVIS